MSWLDDLVKFKLFEGKNVLHDVLNKPSRLLTGVDPFSTNVWNGIKGSHDQALVDQWGGTSKQNFQRAADAGINTGPGRQMEGLAHIIAAMFAAKGISGSGMWGEGANTAATNPALIDSAAGSEGYGASSAGAGTNAYGPGMSSLGSSSSMQMPGLPQQQQQPQDNPWLKQSEEMLARRRLAEAMAAQQGNQP